MVPTVSPMLAHYGSPPGPLAGWAAEPKLDGWRVQVGITPDGVGVRTRKGRRINVAELDPLADLGAAVLLDGELVAAGGRSEDFYALAPALAKRRRRDSVSFAAFDVLWFEGRLVTHLTYEVRRAILEELGLSGPATVVRRWPGTDAAALLQACEHHGVEGLVLKRRDSRYLAGRRSSAWRKVKCPEWRDIHGPRRRPPSVLSAEA